MKRQTLVLFCLVCAAASCARGQRLDIAQFGARCDGRDDAFAVQRALRALPNGGTLAVSCQAAIGPRGISLEGKTGVTIQGVNGGGFRALAPVSQGVVGFDSVMFVIRSCQSCTVQDLTIDAANVGVVALGFDSCTSTSVLKNAISNAGPPPANAAIVGIANRHNRYIGNTVVHTNGTGPGGDGARGIWLGNAYERAYEWYPDVESNTIRDTAHTGLVLHAVAAVAKDNLIEGMGDAAGIKVIPAPGKPGITRIVHNTIRNGRANNQGIQLQDADSDGLVIQDNLLEGLADSGIYGAGSNVQVIGNTFRDDRTAGITILEGHDWLIRDNTFSPGPVVPLGAGIRLTGLSGAIRNIRILSNAIGENLHGGIQVYDGGGTISGVEIANNAVVNGRSYGVLIEERRPDAISGVELVSNCFAGNASATVRDKRPGARALAAPPASSSCPSPRGKERAP
jgi:hypothetical protein